MPVYGFGIVVMLLIEKFAFTKFRISKWGKVLITLLLNFFILTILELIGGHLVEFFLHKSYWVIASYIFLFIARKYLDKIVPKVPRILTNIFIIIFLIDFIYSFFIK